MAATATWQILEHNRTDLPLLVAHAAFDAKGITLQVSDLNDIWIEHLDRKGVDARATKATCIIDPRGEDSQYQVLGKHLISIIAQAEGTTVKLETQKNGILLLNLQKVLPAPLKLLSWEARLARSPSPLVKQTFVEPLVNEVQQLRHHQELLFAELAAKDHVITRTLDRLELSQTHLDQIFPQLANVRGFNRHDADRKTLAQHVRGSGSFDSKAWRTQQEQRRDNVHTEDVAQVLQRLPVASRSEITSPQQADWWQTVHLQIERPRESTGSPNEVDNTTVLPSTPVSQVSRSRTTRRQSSASTSNEDEFTTMRSQTPQHETVTESAGRLEPPSQQPERASGARRLGAIGGNKKKPEVVPVSEQAPVQAAPKSKLGAIGGKKARQAHQDQAKSDPKTELEDKPAPVIAKKAFTIGGKKAANGQNSVAPPTTAVSPREEPNSTATSVADEDEAPEARADRKREQMKRQLEASSKTAVKKKRKF